MTSTASLPFAVLLALLLLISVTTKAQFVARPHDLKREVGYAGVPVRYKEVPSGICETTPGVKSYSGYADVEANQHIFFWFFEARNGDPQDAPLTVWINGGPGSSSMIGLFQENGPCRVFPNGTLVSNPYSWNNVSNMLYIDQPVGVGLSYAEAVPGYMNPNYDGLPVGLPSAECPDYALQYGTCGTYSVPRHTITPNSTDNAAENVWKTLQGFMGVFPQYSRREFNFATESYGGHYGPVFNTYFLEQNRRHRDGAHKINLKNVLINNGWFDPTIGIASYYNFTVQPGNAYITQLFNTSLQTELYNALYGAGNCVDMLKRCKSTGRNDDCSEATGFCSDHVQAPFYIATMRDVYDVRELLPDPFPYRGYVQYLNSAAVQEAVGMTTNFTEGSDFVGNAFFETGDDGRDIKTIEDMRELLRNNVSVTLWAGDVDYICNWIGNEAVADLVNHHGFREAGYAALQTSDNVKHGEVRQSGRFSFTRIYEAGHEVPFYQPLASLELFERAINRRDIATGQHAITAAYRTKGPKHSTFREGGATVQNTTLPLDSIYNSDTNVPSGGKRSKDQAKVGVRQRVVKQRVPNRMGDFRFV